MFPLIFLAIALKLLVSMYKDHRKRSCKQSQHEKYEETDVKFHLNLFRYGYKAL